jgi:hypothetical protein
MRHCRTNPSRKRAHWSTVFTVGNAKIDVQSAAFCAEK